MIENLIQIRNAIQKIGIKISVCGNSIDDPIKKISIIIPIHNEEKNILPFYCELKNVLMTIDKKSEIIFVDDCSQDSSGEILQKIFHDDETVKVLYLLGNHGQTGALAAGFKYATGDVIIAMDGDGQHDPKYILDFIIAIEEGYDVVSGWKIEDYDRPWLNYFLSKSGHYVFGKILGVRMKYLGATMKAYRKQILRDLNFSGDQHRFAGALIYYQGIKIKEIPINIRKRLNGKSNYSIIKILKVALDFVLIIFLTKYSKTSFRLFGVLGGFFSFIGLVLMVLVFFSKIIFGISTAGNVSILILGSISIIVGMQFIFFGLISEMISRIYYTANNREIFRIKKYLKHFPST